MPNLTQNEANEINEMNQASQNTLLGNRVKALEDSGGSSLPASLDIPAGSADLPSTNYAEYFRDIGTNQSARVYHLDDGGLKSYEFISKMPNDLTGLTNIHFDIDGYAVTFSASYKIELDITVTVIKANGTWDKVSVQNLSGALTTAGTTQDDVDQFSYSNTLATLNIEKNDLVIFSAKRKTGTNDTLTGNYAVLYHRHRFS
jgi:hypothetical protein